MDKSTKWIFVRNGEVRQVFDDRKQAVRYFKKMLKQTLKDFETQDETDDYDYPIKIFAMEIKPVDERGWDLSLL